MYCEKKKKKGVEIESFKKNCKQDIKKQYGSHLDQCISCSKKLESGMRYHNLLLVLVLYSQVELNPETHSHTDQAAFLGRLPVTH